MAHFTDYHVLTHLNKTGVLKHRHLVETGLAMLFHAHVPASYWVDAFSSATYIINQLPTKLLGNHSPFELLYSRLPNYTNFRAFGCLVYPYLRDYSAHKLAPRSIPCVFIGYNPQYKGYKCLDPDSSRIYITRHARFDEVLEEEIASPVELAKAYMGSWPSKAALRQDLVLSSAFSAWKENGIPWKYALITNIMRHVFYVLLSRGDKIGWL
ncbi:retrovirus-related pol polyprotein from transposon RE1, partial [Tanacetum coccineum]